MPNLQFVRRTIQPTFAASINYGNPITRGLRVAFTALAAGGSESVSGLLGTVGSSTIAAGPGGRGVSSSTLSQYLDFPNSVTHDVTADLTCFAYGDLSSLSSDSSHAICKGTGNCVQNTPYDFGVSSTGALYLVRSNAGFPFSGLAIWNSTATPVSANNRPFAIAASQGSNIGAAPEFYYNGRFQSGTTLVFGTGSGAATASSTGIRIGNRSDNLAAVTWIGRVYMALVWARKLTATEHASIAFNPWQVFQGVAPVRKARPPVAAATGGFFARQYYDRHIGAMHV